MITYLGDILDDPTNTPSVTF